MKNFIIEVEDGFFGGWDITGKMKYVRSEILAYRMQRPIAERTLPKIEEFFKTKCVEIRKVTV